VLLAAAALLMDSFQRLQRVDPGFRRDGVVTFNLGLPAASYPDVMRQSLLFEGLLEKLHALPGVTNVAATSSLPAAGNGFALSPGAVEGRPLPPVRERKLMRRSTILPGYLPTLGIAIKQGRDFTWRDRMDAPNVAIINETCAHELFPGENPLGHRLITGLQSIPREIVGVAADTRSQNMAQAPVAEMYYPATQVDGAFLSVVVRSTRPAASLRPEIVSLVHSLDAGLPVDDVLDYSQVLTQAVADRRLVMLLLGAFAALALALAGMGIYSVIAYGVAQRTSEFGIRMALGAKPGTVMRMVMQEGLRLTLLGVGLGLLVAFALTRFMQSLLFEVNAADPLILGGVALFLSAVAALACFIPARRATRIDPMIALRSE
jgi:predicted permease